MFVCIESLRSHNRFLILERIVVSCGVEPIVLKQTIIVICMRVVEFDAASKKCRKDETDMPK